LTFAFFMNAVADAAEGDRQCARPANGAVIAFTLFAAACLAHNLALAAHEFGHALGTWLGGGEVIEFVVNPLTTSHVYAGSEFDYEHGLALHTWGGVVFGTVIGVLCLIAASWFRRGTLCWIVLHLTGAISLLINGMYLALGSVRPFGDAWALVHELNTPRPLLFLVGLPLAVAFMCVFPVTLRGIGLRRDDSFGKWLLITVIGLTGYALFFAIGQLLWRGEGYSSSPSEFALLIGATTIMVLPVAAFSYWIARRRPDASEPATAEPTWRRAAMVFALAIGLLVAESVTMT
jgi:hypothetical protein